MEFTFEHTLYKRVIGHCSSCDFIGGCGDFVAAWYRTHTGPCCPGFCSWVVKDNPRELLTLGSLETHRR